MKKHRAVRVVVNEIRAVVSKMRRELAALARAVR